MISQVLKLLKSEGLEVKKIFLNKNKASGALVFPRHKALFVFFKKYYKDGVDLYPAEWKVYSIGNPSFFKNPKDLSDHIKRVLGGKTTTSSNLKDCIKIKGNISIRSVVPQSVLNAYAEENKANPTKAEGLFRQMLQSRNIPFREQVPVLNRYIVDFLLFNRIVVEVDGGYHKSEAQRNKDIKRTKALNKNGYMVVRCTNEEVISGRFNDEFLEWLMCSNNNIDLPYWNDFD